MELKAHTVDDAEALAAFTRGVAYVNGDEDLLGTLEVGRRADVAVLSQDIFSIPASDIGFTNVDLTVAGGVVVHGDVFGVAEPEWNVHARAIRFAKT